MVTDVLVIARHVRTSDDGRPEGTISLSGTTTTTTTTGIVQLGMLHTALASATDPDDEETP